jgi:hypothetical protein
MDDFPLRDDLAALERQLALRTMPEPTGLRGKTLAAVRSELARPYAVRLGWRWLAGAAAAVLVGVNFSTSVIHGMDWRLAGGIGPGEVAATARQMQLLAPELPPREALRQAVLLKAGSRGVPAPAGPASLDRVLQQRERETWDTH